MEGNVIKKEMMESREGIIESVMEDFGVRGEIINVRKGKVVKIYELENDKGVK